MKRTIQALSGILVGTALFALGAAPARCADEFCAMGGTLIKVEVDKGKALDWAKDRRNVAVLAANSDAWAALSLSRSDKDIVVMVRPDGVFFGAAGRGREIDERDAEKIFGRDFRNLREVVKREIGDLWKDRVVKIDGGDVQAISDAAGLGVLEKKGRDWELSTQKCAGLDIDVSELK
jgi:hypothetical protein